MQFRIAAASILGLLVLSACAQMPKFQKKSGNEIYGYKVTDIVKNDSFEIVSTLPPKIQEDDTKAYVVRAVGETCKERGYSFFDFTLRESTEESSEKMIVKTDGFCFQDAKKLGLGISLKTAGKNNFNAFVTVDHLNTKKSSLLRPDDLVIKMSQQPITAIYQIKRIVNHQLKNSPKLSTIEISVIREGKPLTVSEPIVQMLDFTFGPEDLKRIKSKYFYKE